MNIVFESVLERDIDFLIMRSFSQIDMEVIDLFCKCAGCTWNQDVLIESVSHSVSTSDGESDVEVVFKDGNDRIAFLIEDKIDAIAQPDQANRYEIRAKKAVEQGKYDKYYVFIVAPEKYLQGNKEASKYENQVSYEQIYNCLKEGFEKSMLEKALDESRHGYVPIEDRNVTEFWNNIYDFVEVKYPGVFNLWGKKGESRGANAIWINIKSGSGTTIVIKADRGYVDLEIAGYADKFQKFSKDNQVLLDEKKLYVRTASKSLAIRKYIEPFDFKKSFSDQLDYVEEGFRKAKELQDLVKDLNF